MHSPTFGDRHWKPFATFANLQEAAESLPAGGYDYLMVASKSLPELEDMPSMAVPVVTLGKTAIVLLQNGIGIEDAWTSRFPCNVVISAMVSTGATQIESGQIWVRLLFSTFYIGFQRLTL